MNKIYFTQRAYRGLPSTGIWDPNLLAWNAEVLDFTTDIEGNELKYEGNRKLKAGGQQLEYTPEHIIEYQRCSEDMFYFAEKYFYIVSLDLGLIKIGLRDYQKEILHNFINHRHNIVLASRQCGKSTMYEIYLTHYILFNEYKSAVILANKEKTAKGLMARVLTAYQHLPKWLQQGVWQWSKTMVELENGCSIEVSSTASTAIRGMSVNLLILDELAFVAKNIFDEFYASVYPTITAALTTKVIMVSTPNGKNHFYKFWTEAEEGRSSFFPTKVYWWQIPGKDLEWEKETRANFGNDRFEQEFNISFIGSTNTLISTMALETLVHDDPIEKSILHEKIRKEYHRFLKVYEEPRKDRIYSMGIDSSKMCEEIEGDAVTIQVVDVTEMPFEQVCSFNANSSIFTYHETPEVAEVIGLYYNEATAFIENNEIGQSIADSLWRDYEYENVFFEKGNLPGFRTTTKTKRLGISNLRSFIENDKLEIRDFETISQLSTFVRKGSGSQYGAEQGYQDDAVMSLVSALFFLQVPQYNHFEDKKEFLRRLKERKEIKDGEVDETVEEDVPAFGFTGDSIDDIGTVF